MTDPDQLLLDGRTLGEADAGQAWHRVDLGDLGRSLCDLPGDPLRAVVTQARGRYCVTVGLEGGGMDTTPGLTEWGLAGVLLMHGRGMPGEADLAWLAGGEKA